MKNIRILFIVHNATGTDYLNRLQHSHRIRHLGPTLDFPNFRTPPFPCSEVGPTWPSSEHPPKLKIGKNGQKLDELLQIRMKFGKTAVDKTGPGPNRGKQTVNFMLF